MKGVIVHNDYTYEGDIVDDLAHGYGTFRYNNGDVYTGECLYNKSDGFGVYLYKNGSSYTGFFSFGKFNGIGTYEDSKNTYKGTWRFNYKHGSFYCTKKSDHITYSQKWIKNNMIEGHSIHYIQPNALKTTKKHPGKSQQLQRPYNGKDRRCMACCTAPTNATNTKCGHVVMCFDCLHKCDVCPVCRAPVISILKLFVS